MPATKPKTNWFILTILVAFVAVFFALLLAFPKWRAHQTETRIDQYQPLIDKYAELHDLPPALVRSVIRAESSGRADATSHLGAKGLMQVMGPAESDVLRARGWQQGDLYDPEYNIRIGTAYLLRMAARFGYDYDLAVAAYHQGAKRTDDLRKQHPGVSSRELIQKHANKTTAAYVRKVLDERTRAAINHAQETN